MRFLAFLFLLFAVCSCDQSSDQTTAIPAAPKLSAGATFVLNITGVTSLEAESISGKYTVSQEGDVQLPRLKYPLVAAGLTHAEFGLVAQQAYVNRKIYVQPRIKILTQLCENAGEPIVTLGGEMRNPGDLKWKEGLTLLAAINEQGGVSDAADRSKVTIYRKREQLHYDLQNVTAETDPLLVEFDQVVIARLPEAKE